MQVNSATTTAPSTTDSTDSQDTSISASSQMLSEQDFLNLLVTQMTAQDPLDPTNSADLLTQMVQFSTLSANTNLQTQLGDMQSTDQFSQAGSLIGMQVTLQTDSSGDTTQGIVTGVDVSSGTPEIVVNNTSYPLSDVTEVTPPPASQTSTTAN